MTVELETESNVKVLNIKIGGKLSKEDYQKFVPKAEQLIEKFGKIRILFEMQDFHGWEAGALWEDVKFDIKHFSDIERLAFVGDKAWEKGMSVFCRPFTTAKIRFFEPKQRQEAIEWLEA